MPEPPTSRTGNKPQPSWGSRAPGPRSGPQPGSQRQFGGGGLVWDGADHPGTYKQNRNVLSYLPFLLDILLRGAAVSARYCVKGSLCFLSSVELVWFQL